MTCKPKFIVAGENCQEIGQTMGAEQPKCGEISSTLCLVSVQRIVQVDPAFNVNQIAKQ